MARPPVILSIWLGVQKDDFERAKPVFETSAELVIYTGKLGSGTTLKLANNLMTYALTYCSLGSICTCRSPCGGSQITF